MNKNSVKQVVSLSGAVVACAICSGFATGYVGYIFQIFLFSVYVIMIAGAGNTENLTK